MNTSLNRKDIEEFWRRSNSICDQQDNEAVDNLQVQVRRMSLADFTGLAPKPKLSEIKLPTWKSSVSQTSLMNSFSIRRRSVLSTDSSLDKVTDSPAKRLSVQIEEQTDVHTALSSLKKMFNEMKSSKNFEKNSIDLSYEKSRASEAILHLQQAAKQLNQTPSSSQSTQNFLLSETVSAGHNLCSAVRQLQNSTSVYYFELLGTEIEQVFESLFSFVSKLDSSAMSANISTPSRKMSLVSSSYSQLIATLNCLNRVVSSI